MGLDIFTEVLAHMIITKVQSFDIVTLNCFVCQSVRGLASSVGGQSGHCDGRPSASVQDFLKGGRGWIK